jgi:nicotinamide-nucleotide amidase
MVGEGYRKSGRVDDPRGLRVASWEMITDSELYQLAARAGARLHACGRRLATAESCTAGWIAKALTDVPGSSQWFECGYVTYSDAAKMRDLGVAAHTLAEFGAVSEETARAMAAGALRVPAVSVALAVTGIAGPDGGTPAKPVGTVWLCAAASRARDTETLTELQHFPGDRAAVRRHSVQRALELLLRLDL